MSDNRTVITRYRVDMEKLFKKPLGSTKCTLPITQINEKEITDEDIATIDTILFSENLVEQMREKYPFLSQCLGPEEACTIYDYNGTKSHVRLYPTNSIEIISTDGTPITSDIKAIINKHNLLINAMAEKQNKK